MRTIHTRYYVIIRMPALLIKITTALQCLDRPLLLSATSKQVDRASILNLSGCHCMTACMLHGTSSSLSTDLPAFATSCTLAVEVTVPYVAAGKREEAAVLDPIVDAKAFAPAWDPSKNVVVLVTTMDPADTLSMTTSTLYELSEALIVLMNCKHRGIIKL